MSERWKAPDVPDAPVAANTHTPDNCTHEGFSCQCNVQRMLDSGCFAVDITVTCVQCGSPFRFLGLPAGINFTSPTVSIDGIELHAPIEPEGAKRLHSSASFTMPEIPVRH